MPGFQLKYPGAIMLPNGRIGHLYGPNERRRNNN
jgi:hypothetical protein